MVSINLYFQLFHHMHSHKILSYCNRYNILKPNNQILMLRNKLEPTCNQNYFVAKSSELSIRKYHRYCQNLQHLLGLAEWRLQAPEEIAHCYYIQLGKPKLGEKNFQLQLYTEHMDLLLKDMNKLITAESLYILIKTLKGYQKLLIKFGKISVNQQTIGVNSQGNCIVWLNRQLQSMTPQTLILENQSKLINCLINLIKSKSEFASQNVLNSILEFASKNGSNIQQTLSYIQNCIFVNKISVATNLRYLVNRNRLILDLKNIENTNNLQMKFSKQKKHKFLLTKESRSKENYEYKTSNSQQERINRNLKSRDSLLNKKNFVKTGQPKNEIVTQKRRSFVQLFSSKTSNTSNSIVKPRYSIAGYLVKRSFVDQNMDSDSNYMKSLSKSREKSNIFIINHLQNLDSTRSISSKLANSQRQMTSLNVLKVSQTQTASSLMETQKGIVRNNSLSKLQKAKVHKSFINKFPLNCEKEKVQQQERQSCESSPEKDNKSNQIQVQKQAQRSLEMSFGFSSQKKKNEMILKENNWIKTFEGLLSLEAKMNNSILEGPDKNDYLSDVKLEKLDLLTRNMVQSLMPSTQLQLPTKQQVL